MNRVSDMPLPENLSTDLLLLITMLIFVIFSTGHARPATAVPSVIIAPS